MDITLDARSVRVSPQENGPYRGPTVLVEIKDFDEEPVYDIIKHLDEEEVLNELVKRYGKEWILKSLGVKETE